MTSSRNSGRTLTQSFCSALANVVEHLQTSTRGKGLAIVCNPVPFNSPSALKGLDCCVLIGISSLSPSERNEQHYLTFP